MWVKSEEILSNRSERDRKRERRGGGRSTRDEWWCGSTSEEGLAKNGSRGAGGSTSEE